MLWFLNANTHRHSKLNTFEVIMQLTVDIGLIYGFPQKMAHCIADSISKSRMIRGFPGGAVVENLPAKAGDTGSSSGLGRSHMPQSNWAREPQLLSLRFWSLCSATREAAIVRGPRTAMKSGPRLLQLEKAFAQKRRPNTAKNKLIN